MHFCYPLLWGSTGAQPPGLPDAPPHRGRRVMAGYNSIGRWGCKAPPCIFVNNDHGDEVLARLARMQGIMASWRYAMNSLLGSLTLVVLYTILMMLAFAKKNVRWGAAPIGERAIVCCLGTLAWGGWLLAVIAT